MKARNVRICKRVVAIAMATSFTVIGTAAKVSGDVVKFSPDLVKGYYYDEDVKQYKRDLDFAISGGSLEKDKVYTKNNKMRLNYR